MNISEEREVLIEYTNWKGVTSIRRIVPDNIWFGSTEFHKERQWLLTAFDVEKQDMRTFAVKDIHRWMECV